MNSFAYLTWMSTEYSVALSTSTLTAGDHTWTHICRLFLELIITCTYFFIFVLDMTCIYFLALKSAFDYDTVQFWVSEISCITCVFIYIFFQAWWFVFCLLDATLKLHLFDGFEEPSHCWWNGLYKRLHVEYCPSWDVLVNDSSVFEHVYSLWFVNLLFLWE